MALKKLKTLPTGATCEYWRIINIKPDYVLKKISVHLAGYVSEQARKDKKRHIVAEHLVFDKDVAEPTRTDVYSKIKESKKVKDKEGVLQEQNFFADALDV